MREILFRGKRVDNGELVFGTYYKQTEWYGEPEERHFIIVTHESLEYDQALGYFEVNPATVGQYTGLKDKNGKRMIFEGDIVKRCFTLHRGENKKTREIQVGVVRYQTNECGFALENVCNLRKPWDGDTLEIIGNIHDHPELIGGGGDG